ncbi:MAG: hypothetical protein IJR29_08310 [Butyrivibrio sp.]|nr:hypothetical protein [Butyrivibrio sp.]
MQLKDLLENIPLLFQYFIPGFVSLSIFLYLSSKRGMESQSKLIFSVVISYLLIAFTEVLIGLAKRMEFLKESVLVKSAIAILIGIACSTLMAWIFRSTWFSKLLVWLFNKTPNDDIWMDILNFKKGSNLKIYGKDCDYYIVGHHLVNEEKGNESWFAVTAYSKYSIGNEKLIEDHSNDDNAILAIRLSDIDHMEIFN